MIAGGGADVALKDGGPGLDMLAMDAGHPGGRELGDGGAPDALANGAGASSGVPERYVACSVLPPDPLPAPPVVVTDVLGRPFFDRWRDLSCEDVAPPAPCRRGEADASGDCPLCLFPEDGDTGYCASETDVPPFHPLSFRAGSCMVGVREEQRARFCCHLPGLFDCRAWPYPQDGLRGQVCSVHEDCERGLVCKATPYQLGRCMCPNESAASFEMPADCVEVRR